MGFFLGKVIGYLLSLIFFLTWKNRIIQLSFFINMSLLKDFSKRAIYLFFIGLLGWLSGYGFMNIGKLVLTDVSLVKLGYTINVWMVFLLAANGINSVFEPRLKIIFDANIKAAVKFARKVHFLYILLITGIFLIYFLMVSTDLKNSDIGQIIDVIPYALLIFFSQSFHYVSTPFYYFTDNYRSLSNVTLISSILAYSIAITLIITGKSEQLFLVIFVSIYFIRAVSIFLFCRYKILTNY